MRVVSVPNAITGSRLLLAALFGYLLFAGYGRWTLFGTFALAAVTDGFDGFLARRLGQVTAEGAALDQMVDRAFTVVIVLLLLAHDTSPEQNLPLLLGLSCAREIVGLPGVLIVVLRRMRLHHVEYVGKLATFVQSVTLGSIVLGVSWALMLALPCAVVGVLSGASYLRYALTRATPPRSP